MAKTIYKYSLESGAAVLQMPKDARVLAVHDQHGVTLWAEVDDQAEEEIRRFIRIGTGWDIDYAISKSYPDIVRREYIGTAFCGPLVWHVYECFLHL